MFYKVYKLTKFRFCCKNNRRNKMKNCCKQEVGNSYSLLTSFESINAWLNTAGFIDTLSFRPPEKMIKISTSHTSNIRQVYIYIYIYTHTHTHTYIYIYIYIYTHTHTHTHIYIYIYIYIWGASRSKERFAIKKYLLIIGKKKNMQVLSHTFTYFST